MTIYASNRYLIWDGPPEAAYSFTSSMHELAAEFPGLEFSNFFCDFLLSIETELIRHDFLNENFEPTEKLK